MNVGDMSTADIILNVLMAFTVALQCFNAYLVNTKRILIYPLGIFIYFGYLVVEGWVAMRDLTIAGIGLFILVDVVWIVSAIHGWRKHGSAIQRVDSGTK